MPLVTRSDLMERSRSADRLLSSGDESSEFPDVRLPLPAPGRSDGRVPEVAQPGPGSEGLVPPPPVHHHPAVRQ